LLYRSIPATKMLGIVVANFQSPRAAAFHHRGGPFLFGDGWQLKRAVHRVSGTRASLSAAKRYVERPSRHPLVGVGSKHEYAKIYPVARVSGGILVWVRYPEFTAPKRFSRLILSSPQVRSSSMSWRLKTLGPDICMREPQCCVEEPLRPLFRMQACCNRDAESVVGCPTSPLSFWSVVRSASPSDMASVSTCLVSDTAAPVSKPAIKTSRQSAALLRPASHSHPSI